MRRGALISAIFMVPVRTLCSCPFLQSTLMGYREKEARVLHELSDREHAKSICFHSPVSKK